MTVYDSNTNRGSVKNSSNRISLHMITFSHPMLLTLSQVFSSNFKSNCCRIEGDSESLFSARYCVDFQQVSGIVRVSILADFRRELAGFL